MSLRETDQTKNRPFSNGLFLLRGTGKDRKLAGRRSHNHVVLSVLSLLTFLALWQIATEVLKIVPSYAMPSVTRVITTFVNKLTNRSPDGSTLLQHILASLQVAGLGFFTAAIVGVPLGIAMGWYRRVDLLVKPVFDLIRPVPPIAWIPLMVLWFGIGLVPKAFIVFIPAFISCLVNSYSGIKQTKEVHIWVAQSFGASNFRIARTVAVPSALPMIFTGLRIGLGCSWVALVAAELLASTSGLGYMIQVARVFARVDLIIVGMLTIGAVGALLAVILFEVEKRYLKGRVGSDG